MKNKIITSILTVGLLVLVGCSCGGCGTTLGEKYSNSDWTPDSFNYTHAVDHEGFKPSQHYFGLSWNLKPEPKK